MATLSNLKVAIVHDWIVQNKGAEKCTEALCDIFPNADVYTLLYKKGLSVIIDSRKVYRSRLQRRPFWKKYYRYLFHLMPREIERFNFDKYDLVLSVSWCCAKGVITSPQTCHISYVQTPMRYVWDSYPYYFGDKSGHGWLYRFLLNPFLQYLRLWDQSSSSRPDYLTANSKFVQNRISKYWGRSSEVIYPPVNVGKFGISDKRKDYFLMVTSFEPNKRVDIAVRAFTELGIPLKIVGSSGRLESRIKRMAGMNVEFLGYVSDDELARLYREARAFVMPGIEDFGIAPLEAISCGVPVIAFGGGGALDTVIPINPEKEESIDSGAKNGVFFYDPTFQSLKNAVRKFMEYDLNEGWDRVKMRKWAKRFSVGNYKMKMKRFISKKYDEFKSNIDPRTK
jgi:glycosyltransferase involved in cell wall biosynthesis